MSKLVDIIGATEIPVSIDGSSKIEVSIVPDFLDNFTDQEILDEYIKRFSPLAKAMKEEENE